eukprot:TRINITY_DN1917_c0_g1_i2.p1 TRINITY_DN1917_c0_g1~~TRINITY_DN1917_c0_g1_i2.p1  ORF type:complete len:154 (-),score=21.11 TRINITY_DN1917_c0_g1_i2:97-558(-)
MPKSDLKKYARDIDTVLNQCKYKTLVHGDAKLANFCFSKNLDKVAGVDFQYVGPGCGMKDVAYFLSSCFSDKCCETYEQELLHYYFSCLRGYLPNFEDFELLLEEWSELYYFAWADFHRFEIGWCGYVSHSEYNSNIVERVVHCIKTKSYPHK